MMPAALRPDRLGALPLIVCLGLLTAGCALDGAGPASPSGGQGPETASVEGPPPAESDPAPESTADPGRDRARPALAALPPVDSDPDQFLGLDGLEVSRRLGAPNLVRRDGSAEVWQYRGPDCLIDIFLYAGNEGVAGLTARYVDLRSPAKTRAEGRACLEAMLRAEQRRRAGS